LITRQIHADIRRLVAALPDNQREVLVMRYYKNMSFKEIADATQVSINTALGRMRYALLNIRKMADDHQIQLSF
ncbi:MAG: RNA polymerase subunit sigma-24, partial [Porphyromonadaceae bacterium]|nr:RNA polymerase subunit sigma-24 [Porphyromonadaceae bacterium]